MEDGACTKETLLPACESSSLWCNWGTKGEVIIHWIHRKSLDPWWWLLAQPIQELHIFPNFSWWGATTTMGTLGSHLCPIFILSLLTKSQVRTIPSIIKPYSFHRSIPSGHSLPALFQTCPNVFSCGWKGLNTLTFKSANMAEWTSIVFGTDVSLNSYLTLITKQEPKKWQVLSPEGDTESLSLLMITGHCGCRAS